MSYKFNSGRGAVLCNQCRVILWEYPSQAEGKHYSEHPAFCAVHNKETPGMASPRIEFPPIKKGKKVLFLDIDGVLTTATWKRFKEFNPVCVDMLKLFLRKSGQHELVISSVWRYGGIDNDSNLDVELKKNGLKEWLHTVWATPILKEDLEPHTRRGHEIQQWLDNHPKVKEFVILDDDSDMLPGQMDRFIKTDPYNGFLFEHFIQLQKLTKVDCYR